MTMAKESSMSKEMRMSKQDNGHLYMQTNEVQNAVVHYRRAANGTLAEMERIPTGGAGSGVFKPISGQDSAPNAFEGAGSIAITPDRRFLFTTNGGDNSVSSFSIDEEGRLTLLDVKPTGNPVEGRSGTAKSLAYSPSSGTLYVLHSFGPDHVRLMTVHAEGKLAPRPECYTINTHDKPNRVPTMVVVSPNEKFLFVGTTFDEPIVSTGLYPDGSPILWVQRGGGAFHSIASNAPDPDGLAVFPLREDGSLGTARFYDGGAPLRSTSPSCTVGRIPLSSDVPSATASLWARSTKTARSASARSSRSTQAQECRLSCVGHRSHRTTKRCTPQTSATATSAATA
jgi:hypothetical protein